MTGGAVKNEVYVREHADITGCKVVLPREQDAVLLGSSILAAVASNCYPSILEAMSAMNAAGTIVSPHGSDISQFHSKKYAVFLKLYEDQMTYKTIMS